MEEQEKIFSPQHERLSNIAYWAKIASRVILFLTIAYEIVIALGNFVNTIQQNQMRPLFNPPGPVNPEGSLLPYIEIIVGLAHGIAMGIVYYLALKGISLGLDMIIETDINYRAKEMEQMTNE